LIWNPGVSAAAVSMNASGPSSGTLSTFFSCVLNFGMFGSVSPVKVESVFSTVGKKSHFFKYIGTFFLLFAR
jgi:hypothetical protein